ncbi:putative ribonuclease H-like domain-containing protein [Tanacetum coccineum]|uniref:Ribonuclease H-like domain-containing protein n=1 Tax=Tanacetum coccineum TaxID=301880 RepID=A0ABQ5DMQ5_9ASTR
MAMSPLVLINPRWSARTATRGDTLPRSAELQENKTTRTGKAQEGVYQWRKLLPIPWCYVMVLVDMTRVIRQRKDLLTMHSWLTHLQVLILRFKKSELMVVAYKTGLQSVEERLKFYKKNESVYVERISDLKWDIQVGEITIEELRKKLEIIIDNCKKGLGYNAVPPPLTGNFMPPKPDLSFTGLEEFINEPVVIKCVVKNSEAKASEAKPKAVMKNNGAKIIEDWVSDSEEENVDCNYQRVVKPVWNHAKRVNRQNFAKKTHPCPKKNMVPRAVLMKFGLVLVNTVRQVNVAHSKTTMNAARPKSHFSKTTYSIVKRPFHKKTAFKNSNFNQRVNTAKDKKVWKPKTKVLDHVSKHNSALITLKKFDYGDVQGRSKSDQEVIDSGCSRHMTENMSYLTDYEEIDRGYVAFGGNPKGGKITGKFPRKNNMYSVDLKNIVPKGGLTCLFAKATSDESKLWHRRLGHLNFKTMNKLVKGNLVRGLPSKLFENDETCVACQKGKQHRASCKSKTENSISLPLHLLHMDLFGPTFVKSLMKKMYCLVVTDDYSRFTWVFFLASKDETSGILKSFITGIENLVDHKVKVIRCDNGTEFKNKEMNKFCEKNGILRQYSLARTPQQNGLAERRNRTLIKAAKTMLANYKTPTLSFMRPFGYLVTILNTIDHLGKFDGKADEGFFVGYSLNSKAFRVFNSRTRIVKENLHIRFSESTPNDVGSGPDWLFDIDALTRTMNYEPIVVVTQSNGFIGTKASDNSSDDDGFKPSCDVEKKVNEDPRNGSECNDQKKKDNVNSTNNVNTVSSTVNAAGTNEDNAELPVDLNMPALEDYSIFDLSSDDQEDGTEADMNNFDTTIQVSPIPTTRVHKDHPLNQVIRDLQSGTQTRNMSKNLKERGFEEPKKVIHALKDPSWIEAMQEELLQFKLQEVWTLVELPNGKRAIGTKWVFRNKKVERGIVIRNKARLVAQGYTQEEVIDYDEVIAPVARIEAIRPLLVVTVALQRGVATTAAVGLPQVHHLSFASQTVKT